jgi:hypothetical protein
VGGCATTISAVPQCLPLIQAGQLSSHQSIFRLQKQRCGTLSKQHFAVQALDLGLLVF